MVRFSAALLLVLGVFVACGDDDTNAGTGGLGPGTGSSGGADAGRDAKEFVDETDGSVPDPKGRKPNDPLRVFVTKATFDGDLDGTSAADAKCKEAAEAANIEPKGKWVAWLSTAGGQNVKERVIDPAGTLPYELLDGTAVAKKAGDLLADPGFPLAAISLTETKEKATGHAWTGTKNLGEPALTACLGWTVAETDNKGGAGDLAAKDATWTELTTTDTCDTKNHLYCFEVP